MAWTSDLSTESFAAVRSVGFEPVGQVMGVTVQRITAMTYGACGVSYPRVGRAARVSGVAGTGATSGSLGFPQRVAAMYRARRDALVKLSKECAALGGDGVVGADLVVTPIPGAIDTYEFRMIGTAVRGPTVPGRRKVFTSHVAGQDFAKLLESGWVPVGVAFGVAIGVRHDDYRTRRSVQYWRNNEIPGYTELMHYSRTHVREELAKDVAGYGAAGVVTGPMTVRVWQQQCGQRNTGLRDHVARVSLLGTAITPFRHGASVGPPALQVMRLDQSHGQVVGKRLSDRELG